MGRPTGVLHEYYCDICGNKHMRTGRNMYKLIFHGRKYNFCSYTCYDKAMTVKERAKSTHDYTELRELLHIEEELA